MTCRTTFVLKEVQEQILPPADAFVCADYLISQKCHWQQRSGVLGGSAGILCFLSYSSIVFLTSQGKLTPVAWQTINHPEVIPLARSYFVEIKVTVNRIMDETPNTNSGKLRIYKISTFTLFSSQRTSKRTMMQQKDE